MWSAPIPAWLQVLPFPDEVERGTLTDLTLHRKYVQMRITSRSMASYHHLKSVAFMAILPSSIIKMLCLVFPYTSSPNHLAWSQQKHSVNKLTRLLFPPLASLANMQPFPNKPHETGCRNLVTHVLRCEKACNTIVMSGQMLLRKEGNSWMIWWNMRSESVYMSTYVKIKLTLQIHVYIQWCYNGASLPTTYSRWKAAHLAASGWRHCECEQATW